MLCNTMGVKMGKTAYCLLNHSVNWGAASLNSLDTLCRWHIGSHELCFHYVTLVQIVEAVLDENAHVGIKKIKMAIKQRNGLMDKRTWKQTGT